jgi:hypothetical protein
MASKDNLLKRLSSGASALWGLIKLVWPTLTPAIILSTITAFVAGAIAWVQNPKVYIPALVFGYFFVIFSLIRYRRVRILPEYEYCLTPEMGWAAIPAKFPPDHPGHKNEPALVLTRSFRNVCNSPIRVEVHVFDIRLDGRTFNENQSIKDSIWPRMSFKTIRSPFVVRDASKSNLFGTATIVILYGPVKGEYTRKYTYKCNLEVINGSKMMEFITEETDEDYDPR